jgi:Uri superfamily endonuclease
VGSAQNNLEKRIERHLRKKKQRFWHIDYLLCNDEVQAAKVFWKKADKLEECLVAKKLLNIAIPILDFGCSDCRCISHLFWLGDSVAPDLKSFLTSNFTYILNF